MVKASVLQQWMTYMVISLKVSQVVLILQVVLVVSPFVPQPSIVPSMGVTLT